ncbi:hypothetical protein NSQ89_15075 [Niallia sp. FSL R7-0648]|uniref:hypothetical protein n=1 Tax=Niallia sp. FSL R7-0648 TaxID=2954521 RepID=UPI0030F89824
MQFHPKFERKQNYSLQPRKIRSDKKHDIKFYVSEEQYQYIVQRALWQRTSVTAFATEKLMRLLERRHFDNPNRFPIYPYVVTNFMVHVKVDHQTYDQIVSYATQWNEKVIRKVIHRLFHYGLETRLI